MHFEPEILRDFIRAELRPEEARRIACHLLTRCERCQQLTAEIWKSERENDRARLLAYEPPGELLQRLRWQEMRVLRERREAPSLVERLEALPLSHQLLQARNNSRFQTVGLCELLMKKAWEGRFDDAKLVAHQARLAVTVAESLDVDRYGSLVVHDVTAEALAQYGNAMRILSEYDVADRLLTRAQKVFHRGSQDLRLEARILHFHATLRIVQQRFSDALSLFDEIIELHTRCGEDHAAGEAMADQAVACRYLNQFDVAIDLIHRALELLDPAKDIHALLAARHNLALYLHESGRQRESRMTLKENLSLFQEYGDRLNLARLYWLEGKVSLSYGSITLAEHAYLKARDHFIEQGIGFDAAEVSLELALLYHRDERTAELRRLAVQMVPIFQSTDMHLQAMAAVLVFVAKAETEDLTAELIQRLLNFLREARNNPEATLELD